MFFFATMKISILKIILAKSTSQFSNFIYSMLFQDGQAALYFAVSEGHADVIELLINYGAAVAVTDISIVF